MTGPDDFEDRLAARLLGVDVDADPATVRARFRRLARAVHPDTAVGVACVDLGRLAVAKQRLVARAEARADARRGVAEQERHRREHAAAQARLVRIRREQEAHQRLERMRAVADLADPVGPLAGPADRPSTDGVVPRRRSASVGRVGLLVDLAG